MKEVRNGNYIRFKKDQHCDIAFRISQGHEVHFTCILLIFIIPNYSSLLGLQFMLRTVFFKARLC
jgi:hypothetical protein